MVKVVLSRAHVDVLNSYYIVQCSSSSLLGCKPSNAEAQDRFPCRDMSVSGTLVEDGDDLGQV
jgi:hypothetical protein